MLFIFIRGVPGTGKTIVSKLLKKELINSEIINVDDFKIKAIKEGGTFEDAKKIAYDKSLSKLYEFHSSKKDYIILEELICEKEFLNKINSFLKRTKSDYCWFRLMRKIKDILIIENKRERKLKNNLEDFKKIKKEIELLKIKKEYWIKNDNLDLTLKRILKIII